MKNTVERYILAVIWYIVHWNDSHENKKDFYYTANRIGQLEEDLVAYGVSETTLTALQEKAKEIIKTPLDKFPKDIQKKITRVIFGGLTKWG